MSSKSTIKVYEERAPLQTERTPSRGIAKLWFPIVVCLILLGLTLICVTSAGPAGYNDSPRAQTWVVSCLLIVCLLLIVVGGLQFKTDKGLAFTFWGLSLLILILALFSTGLTFRLPTQTEVHLASAGHLARPMLQERDENLVYLRIALTSASLGELFWVLMLLTNRRATRWALGIFMSFGLGGGFLFFLIFMIKG